MRMLAVVMLLALGTPAQAFIDLGFVAIPGLTVGYEARIRQFGDPAQSVDYWFASNVPICCGAFAHDFGPPFNTEYLQLASQLGLANFTPPMMGPVSAVPEPSTWALMLVAFGLLIGYRKVRSWKGSWALSASY